MLIWMKERWLNSKYYVLDDISINFKELILAFVGDIKHNEYQYECQFFPLYINMWGGTTCYSN